MPATSRHLTAEELARRHGVEFVETTNGPAPVRAYAWRRESDAYPYWQAATREQLHVGDVVLVRVHGRLRAALVIKLGPRRATVRVVTPAARDHGRRFRPLAGDLDALAARYRERAERSRERIAAGKPYLEGSPDWNERQAAEIEQARDKLAARGITGRPAVVAWATTANEPAVHFERILVGA